MTQTAEQFLASAKTAAADLNDMAATSLAGFEKLVALNLATAKTAMADAAEQVQAAFAAKAPQDLTALSGLAQPLAEKAAAYGRAVAAIVTETSTNLSKATEGKLAEVQAQAVAAIEGALKQAPAGSEVAVTAFKTAMANGQKALESAQASAKQAAQAVEKNFAAVTDAAVKTTKASKAK
jgi:phasin family protein